ncbi:MAG: bifunctional (p)ppGpp synthetase/guanosine-3',5'-bis(diphosphate) 3'-pyrophosphohydrolase [Betaproteobacteria bacterium]|jgi:GTP pyrophosphokinase|nr:bifunctional (p)ppGpp synthetase/guanosine-3',5'-bis(diphosphate) 3'-pyrophosphohydrolase [Betaproteobacteria bacterium]NDD01717.1 bifunctional (p)ppGpp synthetase/guanosine-3',5'-bis(diphosphate) 3'-pyrophosphohydrolase [Betaproteobacteria bacterium]NDF78903.1 bifunctional (p)ppGpp synthetase/guanosine-3',5'-bis(diphosphate) 3'-pyrophosphohydrolase [Betaproteobacteria bacterium]
MAHMSLPADDILIRARAFAEPFLSGEILDTGENLLVHADAVVAILDSMNSGDDVKAASYLVYTCPHLSRPHEVIAKTFGDEFASLAVETTKLVEVQRLSRSASSAAQLQVDPRAQTENVRKMLLAFSKDLRVIMLRLASRLQTLRYFASSKQAVPASLAKESLQVFAPLANRLGIWEIKWELEDLSFRFLEPDTYKQIAKLLDEKRVERESNMQRLREQVQTELAAQNIKASVQGRPKHIYSIVKKMRGKSLDFSQVFDIRAMRIIVSNVADCYEALSWVHSSFSPITSEFDDYIAKPKPNGYQSLHTVVRDDAGRPIEIQIRTQAMHDHAEHGVAAHWAYKEAGAKGYVGVSANSDYDAKIAVLRQLLAWEREMSTEAAGPDASAEKTGADPSAEETALFDDRIYVLTPNAAIVELPKGATPIDFAYTVHTNLGHRCRGAKADGVMIPLNTPLQNGQTVEITTVKEGGPSRDWMNTELGFLVSHRARAKVRAWFNAQITHENIAKGREAVEKILQREGKTSIKLEDLASDLGFKSSEALFETVGKDEFSLRNIEVFLRPPEPVMQPDDFVLLKKSRVVPPKSQSGVLVVGVDSLLTQLSKCCRPAPPDAISGFVTRGKGVSIHRNDCRNFQSLLTKHSERVIEVRWGVQKPGQTLLYPVEVSVEATDRQGLLRDISEVFAKEKMNVVGVQTQSIKGTAWMTFTVEVADASLLKRVMQSVKSVSGVGQVRRN